MGFRHRHRVRYVECDMQGVLHNSQYLAIVDDAVDVWVRPLEAQVIAADWDFMVKRAEIVWSSPAHLGDELVLEGAATRFGTTSFDVQADATIEGVRCFTATITYVGVHRARRAAEPVPDFVRAHLA
jgi:acyl-CoA thioester hydrolase